MARNTSDRWWNCKCVAWLTLRLRGKHRWRNRTWNCIRLLLQVGFNRCPFQLLRSYKKHEEKKRKIGQERNSMQQAHYQCHRPTPWMQESVSMNARKCLHAQKPYPSQAFAHESSKVRGRGEESGIETGKTNAWSWWKERQPNKTKTHLRNEPRHSSG